MCTNIYIILNGYSDDGALCSKANRHVQSLGCTSGDGGEYLKQWSKMQQLLCCYMENTKKKKTHGKNKHTAQIKNCHASWTCGTGTIMRIRLVIYIFQVFHYQFRLIVMTVDVLTRDEMLTLSDCHHRSPERPEIKTYLRTCLYIAENFLWLSGVRHTM